MEEFQYDRRKTDRGLETESRLTKIETMLSVVVDELKTIKGSLNTFHNNLEDHMKEEVDLFADAQRKANSGAETMHLKHLSLEERFNRFETEFKTNLKWVVGIAGIIGSAAAFLLKAIFHGITGL